MKTEPGGGKNLGMEVFERLATCIKPIFGIENKTEDEEINNEESFRSDQNKSVFFFSSSLTPVVVAEKQKKSSFICMTLVLSNPEK